MGKGKQKRSWVWCTGDSSSFIKVGRRLLCTVCRQKFLPQSYNCEYRAVSGGNGCWHPRLPTHKRPYKHP